MSDYKILKENEFARIFNIPKEERSFGKIAFRLCIDTDAVVCCYSEEKDEFSACVWSRNLFLKIKLNDQEQLFISEIFDEFSQKSEDSLRNEISHATYVYIFKISGMPELDKFLKSIDFQKCYDFLKKGVSRKMLNFTKIEKEDVTIEEIYKYLEYGIPVVVHNFVDDLDVYSVFEVNDNYLKEFTIEEDESREDLMVLKEISSYYFSDNTVKNIYEKDIVNAENVYVDFQKITKEIPLVREEEGPYLPYVDDFGR